MGAKKEKEKEKKNHELYPDVFKKDGKLKGEIYEDEIAKLQVELIKLQNWVIKKNKRILIVFEGRDAAGKGGTIKTITEHLNPRGARVAALLKPSDVEKGQWYFQRYVRHLPDPGEIVLFDRSWYNRAGVERVMEFCTPKDYQKFMGQVPMFEQMLVEDGVLLFKYYLEIEKKEQKDRIESRKTDPLKRWKLSDMDLKSLELYDDYTKAKEEMLARTHSPYSPWIIVNSNDKKRARLNIIKDILSHVDYDGKKDSGLSLASDPSIVSLYSHLAHY
ncbi:MAG: Polyphosphate kinase 2 [Campylobacterota bacterium]|nr:Polyphosphate kinase 2 [Campylobacterota bacterium]